MPDGSENEHCLPPEFEKGRMAIASWVKSLGISFQALSAADLNGYSKPQFACGWRVPVDLPGGGRRLDILLPVGFPWHAPRIALVDRPPFLTWPHIEKDGLICLTSTLTEINVHDPVGVAKVVLNDAIHLVEQLMEGDLLHQFKDEFLTYWDYATVDKSPHVVSLVGLNQPSREVAVWRTNYRYLLGDTPEAIKRWALNTGRAIELEEITRAALVWIEDPLIPKQFPKTAQELRCLIDDTAPEGKALIESLAADQPAEVVTLLACNTVHGPAVVGTIASAPRLQAFAGGNSLTNGFRPGRVPADVLLRRYFSETKLTLRSIDRADPNWIHGRDQDPVAQTLFGKTVVVIGCGSVGAAVALQLAQAGVGRLVLVDFDTLKFANIGRHALGASAVWKVKSKALAEKLRQDFPHMAVECFECDTDEMIRMHGDVLTRSHLIVSATGSWGADARLDHWQTQTGSFVPIVYGWLEAHACAGHAVLIANHASSLQTGFDHTGLPRFSVSEWPKRSTLRQEPACGALFQPYGPAELGFINSLISTLVIDVLIGDVTSTTSRIWIAPAKMLSKVGGIWSSAWRSDKSFREEGGLIVERMWPFSQIASQDAEAA